VLLAFAPVVLGLRTLSQRDTDRMYGPIRTLVVEELRAGRLPLWNPYEGMGKPLFAEGVHSVLHPVSVAGAFLAPGSVDFLLIGYLLFAALGALAFARSLGATPLAAAAAGVAYATCGFTASMTGNPIFLAGAGSLAWMLAAVRWVGAGAPWGPAACAVATAVAIFSGDFQLVLVGGAVGAALAVDVGGWRALPRAAAGLAAGALLAGVQLSATWGALGESARAGGLRPDELVQWALAPGRLVEWLIPGLAVGVLADPLPVDLLGGPTLGGPFAESVYLGAPMLLLAAMGLGWAGRRTRWVLCVAAALLLWVALGHHLGSRQLLGGVPIWSQFRFTEKMMAPFSLLAVAAAALGIDRLAGDRVARWSPVAAGAVAAATATVAMVARASPDALQGMLAPVTGHGEAGAAFLVGTLRGGALHAALGASALLALLRLAPAARRAMAAALLAASTAVATSYGAHFGLASAIQGAVDLPVEAPAPGLRLAHPVKPDLPEPSAYGLDDVDVWLMSERLQLYPPFNVAQRIDSISGYSGLSPWRLEVLEATFGPAWWSVARRFGVTHVAAGWSAVGAHASVAEGAVAGGRLVLERASPPLRIWAVPHAPWASFARSVTTVPGPRAALAALQRLVASGDDGEVVVEAPQAPQAGAGRVLAVARGTESLRVEAESLTGALLVVRDAFWPGWRAWIDGAEVPIRPADLLVRAIPWPAGRHVLEMRYEPPELRVGWLLSALGAAVTGAFAVPAVRRRRSGGAPVTG
jgi:hypothetical protein